MKYLAVIGVVVLIILGSYYVSSLELNKDEIEYKNIWVVSAKDDMLVCIIDKSNIIKNYKLVSKINKNYSNIVADIVIKDNKVKKIVFKPSVINGKLMAIDVEKGYVDIDKYGKVKVDEKCMLYEVDKNTNNDKSVASKEDNKCTITYKDNSIDSLNIGMNNIIYIVEKDKICAMVIDGKRINIGTIEEADNNCKSNNDDNTREEGNITADTKIKVLLKTSNYNSIYHNRVTLKSKDNIELLYISNNEKAKEVSVNKSKKLDIDGIEQVELKQKEYSVKKIPVNKSFTITNNSKYFSDYNRVIIVNKDNKKGITLSNIKRSAGGITYKGNIEIIKDSSGLVVVNEVDLEQYLYSVVPSEMPESFPIEALKAQAICARTYAMNKIEHSGYKKYGAHLDDSISYQVYNNIRYGKNSIQAVDSTKGEVIKYKDKLASVYYYSTSSGYSSTTKDVFGGNNLSYLPSKAQVINNKNKSLGITSRQINNNGYFKKHIMSTNGGYFEKDCEWFRWKITIPVDKLSKIINDNIYKLNKAGNSSNIKVYNKKKKKYISGYVSTIGKLKSIKVKERKSGGLVTKVIIKGSKKSICVENQYTIRQLLASKEQVVIKKNGNKTSNMSSLPSCYFIIEKKGDNYIINGGGFGHGVGMSQYGASELAKRGLNYREILEFYFSRAYII